LLVFICWLILKKSSGFDVNDETGYPESSRSIRKKSERLERLEDSDTEFNNKKDINSINPIFSLIQKGIGNEEKLICYFSPSHKIIYIIFRREFQYRFLSKSQILSLFEISNKIGATSLLLLVDKHNPESGI